MMISRTWYKIKFAVLANKAAITHADFFIA